MTRSPRAVWLPTVACALAGGLALALPRPAAAQQAGAPTGPTPTQTDAEKAAGAQPARPEPGAGVQPTPPPTTEIKPTPVAPVPARPPEAMPAPAPPPAGPPLLTKDVLRDPGYVPGYESYRSLGMSPYSPRVGALPGGLTPGYGAPMPPSEWSFQWTGYLSATMQASINERPSAVPGQSKTVFHVPPQTVDDYQSFVGTSTQPGQWVAMNFKYGNRDVSALVTLSTYNPSQPTTYYALGSQGFINNAYLTYNIPAIGRLRLRATAGYFFNNYGNLGQFGPGMYQMPVAGGPRGIGYGVLGELPLSPNVTLLVEQGFMGNRNGKAPAGNTAAAPNGDADPTFPASYVHHLHAGIIKRGELVLRLNLHWMVNFAQDDRVQSNCFVSAQGTFDCTPNVDNMVTRPVDESHIPDARLSVYAGDAVVSHSVWGQLGVGASHISATNAVLLQGLLTYGGEGVELTTRWLGVSTGGTGSVDVAAFNYSGSIGRMLASPGTFSANGPDLLVNAGAVIAVSRTADPRYDDRLRHKFGVDAYYSFLPIMGAGLRFDRVVPNSKDSSETFHVLAARLVFKSDWASRETVSLIYAKWFYGVNTHPEYSNLVLPWLDDQLIALNVNMWW